MRKKKLEKLKAEIKKDLRKELEKEAEKNKKPKIEKVLKEPVLYHSKDELQEIQKSFLKILLFSAIIVFALCLTLLFSSKFNKKENNKPLEDNNNEEVEIDPINDPIHLQTDGVLYHHNKYILELYNQLTFQSYEYNLYDSTYLYSKDELKVEEMPSEYLLFLLSKTNDFKDYINDTGFLTKQEICSKDGTIRIPIQDLEELLMTNFNVELKENTSFVYTHYVDKVFSTYINFIYSDGYYISSCYKANDEALYKVTAKMLIEDARKEDNELRIGARVVFMDNNHVYGDYDRSRVISENINTDILQYISNADKYEFVYRFNGSNYYLESIVRVNENS